MGLRLNDLLSASAVKHPDRPALWFENDMLTYAELEGRSDKLARQLRALGVAPGDRVAISMRRGFLSVIGIMGILKAGATYVPVDPMSPSSRLEYIAAKCAIAVLLTARERLEAVRQVLAGETPLRTVIVMDGQDAAARVGPARVVGWPSLPDADLAPPLPAGLPDTDYAYILFTSGSTGNPKGVMISHRNSLAFVDPVADFFAIRPDDRLANNSPLHFDLSVFDYFVAFRNGASTVIVPEITTMFPAKMCQCVEANGITVWNSVPSLLSLLANYGPLESHDLSGLRLILFAGEVFPVKYMRRLKQALPQAAFYNVYGQTEANSSTSFRIEAVPDDDAALVPIGKAFPGFEVFALDDDGRAIRAAGERGELYVRGPSVAAGYWGEPEKTRQAFIDDPLEPTNPGKVYKTGDLVTLDAEGNFVFLGRKDQMIKSRGYRIELGEIETAVINLGGVKQAVAVPVPDDLIGNRIAVLVVPASAGAVTKEDVVRQCAKVLPKYMIPEIVEIRESLPMTSSGKVDRRGLLSLLGH